MKNMLRDRRFWICVLLFVALLCPALYFEHMDSPYHPAPYIWLLHALVIASWIWGLYCRWSGRWKKGDGRIWGGCVLFWAILLQLPMCGVSGVSWVLLGVSLGMGGIGMTKSKK